MLPDLDATLGIYHKVIGKRLFEGVSGRNIFQDFWP
jgi:hypothetical protein